MELRTVLCIRAVRSRCGAGEGRARQLWPAQATKEMWQRVSFSTDLDCSKRRSCTPVSDNKDGDEDDEENKIREEEYYEVGSEKATTRSIKRKKERRRRRIVREGEEEGRKEKT